MLEYCNSCNEGRKKKTAGRRKENRGKNFDNNSRKVLYGWAQEDPVCFKECKEMPVYNKT